ncbi:hypothetical protein [Aeoliella sp.]|uniref:hypothetical protein n=1 Tax=Aeoliella sp. TaxID=2795800 RepID=UPI003CCBB550
MADKMTPDQQAEMQRQIYQTIRRAVADELVVYNETTMRPLFTAIVEMQKSLGMLVDGQALIEKHLAGAFDEPEDWQS